MRLGGPSSATSSTGWSDLREGAQDPIGLAERQGDDLLRARPGVRHRMDTQLGRVSRRTDVRDIPVGKIDAQAIDGVDVGDEVGSAAK